MIGLGSIGRGVAALIVDRGLPLTLLVRRRAAAEDFVDEVARTIARRARRGLLSAAEGQSRLDGLRIVDEPAGLADADLVIEAIVEDAAAKRALLSRVAALCGPTAILCSTTSAIPIAALTGEFGSARRTLGLHFLAPVRLTSAVELIPGPRTDPATIERASALCRALGREAPVLRRSVVNLLVIAYVAEGLSLCAAGVPPQVVEARLRAAGFGLGPLATLDQIGLDVALAVIEREDPLLPAFDPRLVALLRELREDGALGRKRGGGLLVGDGDEVSPRLVERLGAPSTPSARAIEATVWTRLLGELLLCVAHDLGPAPTIDALASEVLGLEIGLRERLAAADPGPLLRALAGLEARLGGRYAPTEALLRAALAGLT